MVRNQRHEAILSLIEEQEIETQGELCEALARQGYAVTQATVSRDVKELHLFKVRGTQKRFRYACAVRQEGALSEKHRELFRASAAPTAVSTRFSMPSIRMPTLQLENGTVKIILSRTEYYEYEIKRENRGEITTIYSGPYRNIICDNSVRAGESYVYTVTPRYQHFTGMPVALPSVTLPGSAALPDDWWLDQ